MSENRAYSLITTKSVNTEQRVIRGIATSPTPDRVLDVVDPFGVKVAADIPLFLYHDSKKTVGRASFGKPTAAGIPFEARIPKITEPGVLKDRVDEAWGMVQHGLITAVSIGFRVLDGAVERIKNGGLKYLKTEVFELSLVPVPAQPDAVIHGFKSLDEAGQRAALINQAKSLDHATHAASVEPKPGATKLFPADRAKARTRPKSDNSSNSDGEDSLFEVGDSVQITSGPYEGLTGQIDEVGEDGTYDVALDNPPSDAPDTVQVDESDLEAKSISIGNGRRAASGTQQSAARSTPPGVSGNNSKTPIPETRKVKKVKPISEQIKDIENTRAAQSARMEEVMKASREEGRASTEDEGAEFDGLEAEVKRLDGDLVRLRKLEAMQIAKATPVEVQSNGGNSIEVRSGAHISVKSAKLPPGIGFARFAMTMAAARGNPSSALDIAKSNYPDMAELHSTLELAKSIGTSDFSSVMKASVAAGTTGGTTFAAPLINYQILSSEFIEYLRPQTIIGKFGTDNIPSLRRVPFNVKIPAQTSGGAAGWVGEGAPKPLTSFDFTSLTMQWTKVAAIAVLTEELIRFSSPSAEALVRDSLAASVIERIDIDFVLPSKAAVTGVSPASITNGASTVASAGVTEVDVRTDIRSIMGLYIAANLTPTSGVWIMPATVALQLSVMTNALGNPVFPQITMAGGILFGMPVIVSQYVPSGVVILANAGDIYLADDGQVVIDASREASLEMLTNPSNSSATPTATTMVSMFQANSVAVRAERYISWLRRRAAGVAYLTGVNYTG